MKYLILFFSAFIASSTFGQWNQITSDSVNGTSGLDFFSIGFLDEEIGFAGALSRSSNSKENIYYKTIDGGLTWNTIINLTESGDILFLNETKGFILGDTLLITLDSGLSWFKSFTVTGGTKIQFVNDSVGYIMSPTEMFKTTDSGLTWNTLPDYIGVNYRNLFFLDENLGWVIKSNHVLKTTDGGVSWVTHEIPISYNHYNYSDITFTSDSVGYAVGTEDFVNGHAMDVRANIIKTTNGGETWNRIYFGTHEILSAITFTSPDVGYAVGGGGGVLCTLLKTNNGGASWQAPYSFPFIDNLNTIFFVDESIGFVSGKGILKTLNGGEPLKEITVNPTPTYELLVFPNPAKDIVYVKINDPEPPYLNRYDYEIYDEQGQVIISGKSSIHPSFNVNVKLLKNGLYFIRVMATPGTFISTEKFFVNN